MHQAHREWVIRCFAKLIGYDMLRQVGKRPEGVRAEELETAWEEAISYLTDWRDEYHGELEEEIRQGKGKPPSKPD